MPTQSLKNMTREEYHHLRRTRRIRHSQMKVSVRLRLCWEIRLRHIHHYWRDGKRIAGKDMPPGHYETKVLACRMKGPFTMLWDVEIVSLLARHIGPGPNIQQVPYNTELGTLLKEAYSKHLRD